MEVVIHSSAVYGIAAGWLSYVFVWRFFTGYEQAFQMPGVSEWERQSGKELDFSLHYLYNFMTETVVGKIFRNQRLMIKNQDFNCRICVCMRQGTDQYLRRKQYRKGEKV